MLGGFGSGRSPAGETHWVIVGANFFKEAMDIAGYRRGNTKEEKAWDAYIANNGGAEVCGQVFVFCLETGSLNKNLLYLLKQQPLFVIVEEVLICGPTRSNQGLTDYESATLTN